MDNKRKNNNNYKSIFIVLLIIVTFLTFLYLSTSRTVIPELSMSGEESVSSILAEGKISDVYVKGGNGFIRLTDSKIDKKNFPKIADYYFIYTSNDDLYKFEQYNLMVEFAKTEREKNPDADVFYRINENDVNITSYAEYNTINYTKAAATASFIERALPYVSIIIMVVLGVMIFRLMFSKGGGASAFGKSKARVGQKSNIKFDDIAGADEEKEETKEIVEFLKSPAKFKALGARIPKGVLLVGPPGTGKTLLAKAVAGESEVPFFSISGSDFVELYVGVGASRVRDLFETAKKSSPCIIFIDEIDAVGRQRGAGMGGGNDEREQTLNQLLVEMDGFEGNEGIIVLAATNRADVLDPALLRPGRFDRQVFVNVPDVKGREGIIKIHAKNKPLDPEIDFKALARLTSGFTGADIENFLNEAAILAARNNHVSISMSDITEGINKVIMGPQKKSRLVTEKDKKLTAYHEAGHAIVAKSVDSGDTVHEVSIIPRGMAGGYTSTRPSDDEEHFTFSKLNSRICVLMGGRVAEEIVFGDITAGASSDIKKATEIARKMVTEWGMSSKLGFLNAGKSEEVFLGRDYQVQHNYSEETAKTIDAEIKWILDSNYKKTKELLLKKRDVMDNMSNLLLEQETIYEDEVEAIMKGKDYKKVSQELDAKLKKRKEVDEKKQKEQKFIHEKRMQELKEQTAIALKNAGVISENELAQIKLETKALIERHNKAKEELEKQDEESEKSTKEKAQTQKKSASKSTKSVKPDDDKNAVKKEKTEKSGTATATKGTKKTPKKSTKSEDLLKDSGTKNEEKGDDNKSDKE